MKTIKLTVIAGFTYLILLTSCSKEKDSNENVVVKKCSDSTATNFNKEGDCIYPSDKLAGEYNVTEYILAPATPDTNYFTVSVTKATNVKIALKYTRSDNPTYEMPDTLEINWKNKGFENMQPGDLNRIIDDNKFSIIFFEFTTPIKPIHQTFVRK